MGPVVIPSTTALKTGQARRSDGEPRYTESGLTSPPVPFQLVSCRVSLAEGRIELSSQQSTAKGGVLSGFSDADAAIVARAAIELVADSSLAPQGVSNAQAALVADVGESRRRRRDSRARAVWALGISALAISGADLASPSPVPLSAAVPKPPPPYIGSLCTTPTKSWDADGFLTFPGHLDSALHLGVIAPESLAKVENLYKNKCPRLQA